MNAEFAELAAETHAAGICGDGAIVGGSSASGQGFVWPRAEAEARWFDPPDGYATLALQGCTNDSFAAGISTTGVDAWREIALVPDDGDPIEPLGRYPADALNTDLRDVSANGVIVGISERPGLHFVAFAWDGGFRLLDDTLDGDVADDVIVNGVSADGAVMVGFVQFDDGATQTAVVWDDVGIRALPWSGGSSVAYAISSDGRVVVGEVWDGVDVYGVRWVDGAEPEILDAGARPIAVDGDGSVVVLHNAIWSDGTLATMVGRTIAAGGTIPDGRTLRTAAVSDDGRVFAGISASEAWYDPYTYTYEPAHEYAFRVDFGDEPIDTGIEDTDVEDTDVEDTDVEDTDPPADTDDTDAEPPTERGCGCRGDRSGGLLLAVALLAGLSPRRTRAARP